MMRVWIDGNECDIAVESFTKLPINFDVASLRDVEGARSGRTISLSLPATPRNNAVLGDSRVLYASKRFNMEHHTLRIEHNGVVIFEGTTYLEAAEVGSDGSYRLCATEGGADWVEFLAHTTMSELGVEFSGRLTPDMIASTWEGHQEVCFLPIHRNNFERHYSTESDVVTERVMLTDDYHPFLSVAAMVRKMFAECGYTLRSNFFETEFAQTLYMSGDYSRVESSVVKAKCDFFARRSTPVTATADSLGRVYASTAFANHSLGAVVDTANPNAVDSAGELMSETFSTAGSFVINDAGNIGFKPSVAARVGFVLHAEYTTDYKILSRTNFVGFDTIEGINGVGAKFSLTNSFKDFRNEVAQGRRYRAVVFDHIEGNEYILAEILESGGNYTMGQWSSRSALVTASSASLATSLTLFCRKGASGSLREYSGDWALYEGYVEEEGKVDVEVDVRFPPQEVAAGNVHLLDKLWIGGAEEGMSITLGLGTTLRPYFTSVAGYGSELTFADIAPRGVSLLTMLGAIGEMFNLVFYTDSRAREVYIEPLEEFYDESQVFDFTSRIDTTQGVSLVDIGIGKPQDTELSYLASDLASQSYNVEFETKLGEWSFRNPLYGTKLSRRTIGNTLFTTSCNISKVVGTAPSASIVRVGDIGADEISADLPFTPHIVCYEGLRPLPDGEWWGATTKQGSYPYAAFFDGDTINLCYEDRGGVEGLSRYYKPMLCRERDRQYVSLDLVLSTAEIMDLFTVDDRNTSVRTLFRFSILGESSLFRLSKVSNWDIKSGKIHAIFERIERD